MGLDQMAQYDWYDPTDYGGIIVAGIKPLNTRRKGCPLYDEDFVWSIVCIRYRIT